MAAPAVVQSKTKKLKPKPPETGLTMEQVLLSGFCKEDLIAVGRRAGVVLPKKANTPLVKRMKIERCSIGREVVSSALVQVSIMGFKILIEFSILKYLFNFILNQI